MKNKTAKTISCLPVELLDEICSRTQQPPNTATLSTLSLVSRQFCKLAQPRLLSHLNIGGCSTQLRQHPPLLESLSQGECAASHFAKSLTFDFTLFFPRIDIVVHKHLESAIQSCKKVERIVDIVGNHDPQWLHDHIFQSLQTLPLTELVVRVIDCGTPSLRIGSLFNLRKICIEHSSGGLGLPQHFNDELAILISQCPKLTHLEVSLQGTSIERLFQVINADNTKPPLSIEHLSLRFVEVTAAGFELAVRHLRALKYFGLLQNSARFSARHDKNTDIWAILRREKVVLSTIVTDLADCDALSLYLQAFHGLKNLYVRPSFDPPACLLSPLFLLQIVPPQHSISLVMLDIDATGSRRWNWPFNKAAISALSSFPNLKVFGVTFRSQHAYDGESSAPKSVKTLLDVSLKNFPKLQRLLIHLEHSTRSGRPHFRLGLPVELPQWLFCDVHEAIQAHPVELPRDIDIDSSMPVIECQGVEYCVNSTRNVVTGHRSYVPPYPILFEDLDRAGPNCKKCKYQK